MSSLSVKRSRYWHTVLADGDLVIVSALTFGTPFEISTEDLALIATFSADQYREVPLSSQDEADTYGRLAQAGAIILNLEQEPYTSMREIDQRLHAEGWPASAAVWAAESEDLHLSPAQRKPRDYDKARRGSAAAFRQLRDQKPFPPAFPAFLSDVPVITLPHVPESDSDFYDILARRRSFRYFTDQAVDLHDLARILSVTFGTQKLYSTTGEPIQFAMGENGRLQIVDDGTLVQMRSFPSGGSRHPINTRILVKNVEGLEPGIYIFHPLYRQLQLEKQLTAQDVTDVALQIAANQSWAGDAALLLLYSLVVRRHWSKYNGVNRGLTAMMMEVGAAQATVYYTVTACDLACNFTAMIDSHYTNPLLGLDGLSEKAVGLTAIGHPNTDMVMEMEREHAATFTAAY